MQAQSFPMHRNSVETTVPAAAQQDETRRLLSLLLVMAERVTEEFARQRVAPDPADSAAFAQSCDDLMAVSRLVAPARD
jgi:hypothetical protein